MQHKSRNGLETVFDVLESFSEPDVIAFQETFMYAEQVTDSIGTYRLVINEEAPTDCVLALHQRWLGRIEFIKFHPRAVLVWLRADHGCVLVKS